MMHLVGIDPGTNLTGYACVEYEPAGSDPILVEAGVIRLPQSSSLGTRLVQLAEDLEAVFDQFKPQMVVVESIFAHKVFQSAGLLMGHARGVVLMTATRRGISTDELAPAEVKRALTGNGRATKAQVQQAVMSQCGLSEPPSPPDVADAIAIALCAARREQGSMLPR
jgi:crossover junction endodeoxyribonuclease RuvC